VFARGLEEGKKDPPTAARKEQTGHSNHPLTVCVNASLNQSFNGPPSWPASALTSHGTVGGIPFLWSPILGNVVRRGSKQHGGVETERRDSLTDGKSGIFCSTQTLRACFVHNQDGTLQLARVLGRRFTVTSGFSLYQGATRHAVSHALLAAPLVGVYRAQFLLRTKRWRPKTRAFEGGEVTRGIQLCHWLRCIKGLWRSISQGCRGLNGKSHFWLLRRSEPSGIADRESAPGGSFGGGSWELGRALAAGAARVGQDCPRNTQNWCPIAPTNSRR